MDLLRHNRDQDPGLRHLIVRNVLVKVQKGVKQAKALAGAGAGAEARARARALPGRAFSYFVLKFLLLYWDTMKMEAAVDFRSHGVKAGIRVFNL
ncbi:hypothetical protein SDJN03_26466, partial [Cucurbita argyrosperma subsp. sororia]